MNRITQVHVYQDTGKEHLQYVWSVVVFCEVLCVQQVCWLGRAIAFMTTRLMPILIVNNNNTVFINMSQNGSSLASCPLLCISSNHTIIHRTYSRLQHEGPLKLKKRWKRWLGWAECSNRFVVNSHWMAEE